MATIHSPHVHSQTNEYNAILHFLRWDKKLEKEGLEKLSEAELERMAQEKIKDQKIELEKVKLVQFKDPIHNILNQKGCQSVWSASLKTFITISFILFFLVPVICRDSTNCVAFVCKTRIYGFGNLNESTRKFLFIAIISLVTVDHYLNKCR